MTDPATTPTRLASNAEADILRAAYQALRVLPPERHHRVLQQIEDRLRQDRSAALLQREAAAPRPEFWRVVEWNYGFDRDPASAQDAARQIALWSEAYGPGSPEVLTVVGYAPVAIKYAVRVPVDDGDWEVELFDQAAAAQRLADGIKAAERRAQQIQESRE